MTLHTPKYNFPYPEDNDDPDGPKEFKELAEGVEAAITGAVPPGAIITFAGATAPAGWMLCQGQTLSATTYPALFAAIGSSYGSAASGQFVLPDIRGRIPTALDPAQTEFNALNKKGGSVSHSITSAQVPRHRHSVPSHGHSAYSTDAGNHDHPMKLSRGSGSRNDAYVAEWNKDNQGDSGTGPIDHAGVHKHTIKVNAAGATNTGYIGDTTAIPITQPYIVMNYLIRVI